jgi:hypothetical protein
MVLEQDDRGSRPFHIVRVAETRYLDKAATSVPPDWDTTEVKYDKDTNGSFRSMHYCGDQGDKFVTGRLYRVLSKPVVTARNRGTGYVCERIIHVEQLPDQPEVASQSGKIVKAISSDDDTTVNVTLETDGGQRDLTVCNDNVNSVGFEFSRIYHLLEGIAKQNQSTIPNNGKAESHVSSVNLFYDKGALSRKYGCYPPMAIGNNDVRWEFKDTSPFQSAHREIKLTEYLDQPASKRAIDVTIAEILRIQIERESVLQPRREVCRPLQYCLQRRSVKSMRSQHLCSQWTRFLSLVS